MGENGYWNGWVKKPSMAAVCIRVFAEEGKKKKGCFVTPDSALHIAVTG